MLARAGECAAYVAEQFIFKQFAGHAAAIDGDEIVTGTGAAFVDIARVALLANAGFTGNQDLDIGAGNLGNQIEHPLVGCTLSNRWKLAHGAVQGSTSVACLSDDIIIAHRIATPSDGDRPLASWQSH